MDLRDRRLTVAVTGDEADLIKALASAEDMSVSEFIHHSLFGFMD